jgi:hypothetical protein
VRGSLATNFHFLTCGGHHESLPHGVFQNKVENLKTIHITWFQYFRMKWEEIRNYNPIKAQFKALANKVTQKNEK